MLTLTYIVKGNVFVLITVVIGHDDIGDVVYKSGCRFGKSHVHT